MHIADLDLDFLALSEMEDGMGGEDDEVVDPEELGEGEEDDESSDDEEM